VVRPQAVLPVLPVLAEVAREESATELACRPAAEVACVAAVFDRPVCASPHVVFVVRAAAVVRVPSRARLSNTNVQWERTV
jgi:hypothetical protein